MERQRREGGLVSRGRKMEMERRRLIGEGESKKGSRKGGGGRGREGAPVRGREGGIRGREREGMGVGRRGRKKDRKGGGLCKEVGRRREEG